MNELKNKKAEKVAQQIAKAISEENTDEYKRIMEKGPLAKFSRNDVVEIRERVHHIVASDFFTKTVELKKVIAE